MKSLARMSGWSRTPGARRPLLPHPVQELLVRSNGIPYCSFPLTQQISTGGNSPLCPGGLKAIELWPRGCTSIESRPWAGIATLTSGHTGPTHPRHSPTSGGTESTIDSPAVNRVMRSKRKFSMKVQLAELGPRLMLRPILLIPIGNHLSSCPGSFPRAWLWN